jgi:hypothetical protein
MADYEVGYKKPPRHSQFKPGNRANPHGRGKRKVRTEAGANAFQVWKQLLVDHAGFCRLLEQQRTKVGSDVGWIRSE